MESPDAPVGPVRPIAVWWIGDGAFDEALLGTVRERVAQEFVREVVLVDAPSRPVGTRDPRRGQHSSRAVLTWLLEQVGAGERVLGVTDVDLFIPVLTFVYGEAQLNGPVAVLSTARLGGMPGAAGTRLLGARLAKEAVHELGHTFGLLHCDAPRCAMKRSVNVAAIDVKATTLCGDCRTLLLEHALEQENDHEQGPHADLDRR